MLKKKRDYKILLHHPRAKQRYWEFLQKYRRNKAIKKIIKMIPSKDLPEVINLSDTWVSIPPNRAWPWIEINPYDLIDIRRDVRFIKIKEGCNLPHEILRKFM